MLTLPYSDGGEGSGGSHGTIYLLRHGAVRSVEGGKRYTGWQDVALSDIGLQQAGIWADFFSGIALDAICCSDLSRCLETARMIGKRCSLEPKPFPELREVSLGAWEGQRFDTIRSRCPRAYQERGERIADHRPPGGESFHDLQARVWPLFEAIANRCSGHRLIVTHAGVIRVLLCRLLGLPLENLFRLGQTYGALNIVEVRPANRRILALNLHPDIAG